MLSFKCTFVLSFRVSEELVSLIQWEKQSRKNWYRKARFVFMKRYMLGFAVRLLISLQYIQNRQLYTYVNILLISEGRGYNSLKGKWLKR